MNKIVGVYKIVSPSGKIYIGSSVDINCRFKKYRRLACKAQFRLYNSFLKYGVENHLFEIIVECTKDILLKKESELGFKYNVLGDKGLNCRLPKLNDKLKCFSDETIKKMSDSHKGKKPTNLAQLIQINTGRICSQETRDKISLANKSKIDNWKNLKLGPEKNKRLIKDTITGNIYRGANEAAYAFNITRRHLYKMLNGERNNTTPLVYG